MTVDPITLSVLRSALAGIAEEMGTVLVRSAYSSNIKERRDCSAALFDATGRMIAQAEHIPVHLGAMPESVAAVMSREARPGEVWILNDPYAGGTHSRTSPWSARWMSTARSSGTPSPGHTTPTSAECHRARCPPGPGTSGRRV